MPLSGAPWPKASLPRLARVRNRSLQASYRLNLDSQIGKKTQMYAALTCQMCLAHLRYTKCALSLAEVSMMDSPSAVSRVESPWANTSAGIV